MIHLSENLKNLRKRESITQEQLAEVLSVSPQAVSRWENGTTYPDITMLPTIAGYFDITLDELIGMDKIRDEHDIEEIMRQYRVNASKGHVDRNIELLSEALKRYPKNEEMLFCYALSLHSCISKDGRELTEEEIQQNAREAIKVDERLLENCTDLNLRLSTIKELAFYYDRVGEKEKATELAESLPGIWQTCTTVLDNFYTGEKQKRYLQGAVLDLTEALWFEMLPLCDLNYKYDELTTEERIEMVGKGPRIFEAIFEDDDYYFYSTRVSDMHRYTAAMDMLIGRHEDALTHLEAAAKYAIMFDTLPQKGTYSSLLIKGLEFDLEDTSKNNSSTKCAELNNKLKWDRYDAIRNDERFTAILERIKPYI